VGVPPGELNALPKVTLQWRGDGGGKGCEEQTGQAVVRTKGSVENEPSQTSLAVAIPSAPCNWPIYQDAHITVTRLDAGAADQSAVLFDGTVRVSVWWVPLLVTTLVLASIYPGCALVAWYFAKRRFQRAVKDPAAPTPPVAPTFWSSLDPVQITANAWGRGSLAKLQIFAFSLIVFGVLFYYQLRTGILSGLSRDVLVLLGISAVGTVGGRITHVAKRRLSLDNWAWLRRRGWLPPSAENGTAQAKWRDLVVDADSTEFDPYSFQMAIFSLVVAVALVSSSVSGLASFEIPWELLELLGLSQFVFIFGKASEKSPFTELDAALKKVRERESSYQIALAALKATADTPDKQKETLAKVEGDLQAFRNDAKQAAEMYLALYGDQLPRPIPKVLQDINSFAPDVVRETPPPLSQQ
jgi:hypothetical protein